jgi:hypothetical protein
MFTRDIPFTNMTAHQAALAVLMEGALRREHRRRDDQALLATAATKARQCGEVIWQALRAAQESRPGAEAHSS